MAIKSITLKGVVRDGILYESLTDINLSSGLWELCIKNLAFKIDNDTYLETLSLSTNLVTDYRLKDLKRENYFPTLASCLVRGKNKENVINFDQIWFEINTPRPTLEIFFTNLFTDETLVSNGFFTIQVLFRKIG